MTVLREVSAPQGFNLGMNQGDVAGAGIAAHLHQHVVPRWGGDSNFLPIVAPQPGAARALGDTRARLAAAWPTARRDDRHVLNGLRGAMTRIFTPLARLLLRRASRPTP